MKEEDSYSLIGYASKVHPARDPGHIYTVAALYEMDGVSPERASFLELGCGVGQALFPLAILYPNASFRGIDSSPGQIEAGKKIVEGLAIPNLVLEEKSVSEVEREDEKYDYVLCHGVYSWVAPGLQKSILSAISSSLSENGLGYLSYNTFPGWNFRTILRDFLLAHVDSTAAPSDQIRKARDLLNLFGSAVGYEFERPYSLMMQAELKRIASETDEYLFHELLENENHPVLFTEMTKTLEEFGLMHIADARMSRNELNRLHKTAVSEAVVRGCAEYTTDRRSREQFMDFVFHTPFRESVICRKGRDVAAEAAVEKLERCFFAASFEPLEQETHLDRECEEEFVDLGGQHIFITRPAVKLALAALRKAWPSSAGFESLWESIRNSIHAGSAVFTKDRLAAALFDLYRKDYVDVSLNDAPVAIQIAERPRVTAFAALQARTGQIVTNLRYETVELGDLERELMQFLDGTRDRGMLRDALLLSLAEHGARLQEDGVEISDPERQKELVATLVDDGLESLRKAGLLIR